MKGGMNDVIGEVAKSMAPKAITDCINGAKQEICSVIDYEKSLDENYDSLEEEARQLYKRRDHVVANIKKDNSKKASEECEEWMAQVHNKIEPAVLDLKRQYNDSLGHHGLKGLPERSTLSENIKKMRDEVHKCWEKGSIFLTEEALVDKPPEPIIKINKAPNIENLPSLQGIIGEILQWLRDENVKRIGLWGKVGVGKTAILQNLNNNKQVAEMFDLVIFATLPEEGNEAKSQLVDEKLECAKDKLQLQIARRLKLNIEGNTDPKTIASRISTELESKRYLLILDEVWGTFSLDAIGIQENEKDSKVVLASRYRETFSAEMEVQEQTEVEPLSHLDARTLFFEKLGRIRNQPDIDPIAELVIRECNNLPLVIDIVARTFKKIENKKKQPELRIELWNGELVRLRRWPEVKFQGMDEFFKRLGYCYEALDDKDKKKCFLYGALYPNANEMYIDHFLECWRADEFKGGAEKDSVYGTGSSVISELVEESFLESGEKIKHIRMSKVLRSLALKILSESTDQKYLVRAGENLLQTPGEEEWNGVKWISLMDNRLCSLPEKPDCKVLSTLMLQGNDNMNLIRDPFFQSMESLRVLNLNGTGITMLPESISSLKCLRVLYLNSCNQLNKLPAKIAALTELEVLDIRSTGINCLPGEIKELHQLRRLRVSLSGSDSKSKNVNIDVEVISKFYFLEELLIVVDPQNLCWNEVLICVSKKLAALEKSNRNPRHFQISIGEDKSISVIDCYENRKITRCLKYVNGEGTSHAISEVLAEANEFELDGHKDSFNLSDFGIDSKIKSCKIGNCPEIETIIDATGVTKGFLECLEQMYISNLPKLGSMLKGEVPSGSLAQLTTVSLFKCSKLKKLFSRDMIQQLARLQHLKVQECDEIEEIVMESENNGPEPGELPSLKGLTLRNLPNLRCNWTANLRRNRPRELCEISGCPLQENLP